MVLGHSFPGPTGLTDTTEGRKALAGLIVKSTTGIARSGVFPAHTNPLVTARTDMNVDIAAFTGCGVQFGGPVLLANDGTTQLPSVLVSPGAGTNYYVVYAKQNESTSPGTDANNNPIFGTTLSTASFAAARALLPTGAVELATVEMPTGKTATNQAGVVITATHQFTAAQGGVVVLRGDPGDFDAWSDVADGAMAYRLDTDEMLLRVNGAWVATNDTGWVNISTFASGWAATASHQPRIRRVGNRVDLAGAVTRTTGSYSDILTIPVGFRLTGAFTNYFVGSVVTSTGTAVQMFIDSTTNKLSIPTGYFTGPATNPQVHPLIGSWYLN